MTSKLLRLSLIFSFFTFFGCEEIFECIVNIHPQLPDKELKTGFIYNYYYDTIHAEINNQPSDNNYHYYFTIDDNLPPGIDVYVDYRTVIIEGVPEAAGDFIINIYLQVEHRDVYDCEDEPGNCDHICSDNTTEEYRLRVL
ncbi:hypothetical protein [Winogradskyella sp. 3972H.M.0a.05]|uniref:hypothetical protein n=1 Tax=Winogradskyella sp. 3972H.M.0a.05 TaxID=2950277 RepID=UPI003398F76C